MHEPNYDFEIDLPRGQEAEQTIAFLLHMNNGDFIEVKRDSYVSESNNVAIEYQCKNKPSGIASTEAAWWVIMLNGERYNGEVIVLIKTERLKSIARKYLGTKRDISGGDKKYARMILVPVKELLQNI